MRTRCPTSFTVVVELAVASNRPTPLHQLPNSHTRTLAKPLPVDANPVHRHAESGHKQQRTTIPSPCAHVQCRYSTALRGQGNQWVRLISLGSFQPVVRTRMVVCTMRVTQLEPFLKLGRSSSFLHNSLQSRTAVLPWSVTV